MPAPESKPVREFLDGLLSAGYWRERCRECKTVFNAPEGEEICPECVKAFEEE